jgi:hypothetical protein
MNGFAPGQVIETGPGSWLDRFPTDEIMVMFIVAVVFSTLLLVSITWFVTGTIRTIHIAAVNARMAEKLCQQGIPSEQVERIVRSNWRRGRLFGRWRSPVASRWQMPSGAPGKPV